MAKGKSNTRAKTEPAKPEFLKFRIMSLKAYLMVNYPHWSESEINSVYVNGRKAFRKNEKCQDTEVFSLDDSVAVADVYLESYGGTPISGVFIGTPKAIQELESLETQYEQLENSNHLLYERIKVLFNDCGIEEKEAGTFVLSPDSCEADEDYKTAASMLKIAAG